MKAAVDVLVVGGGPAGLAAARAAAARGREVVLVERQREIAENVRTSGATAERTMTSIGVPPQLYHRVRRLRIASPETTVSVDCDDYRMCVIDVRGVYRWLAAEAEGAGAEILTATRAIEPLRTDDTISGCVVERDGRRVAIRARVVVDAGGHRAATSKRAGLHAGFARFGVGAEYELDAPAVDQDEAVLILSNRHAPTGYAWVFPWGGARVRLGTGVHHVDVRARPTRLLDLLRDEAEAFAVDLDGATEVETHNGLIPADGLAPRLVADGIVAAGDAAGQVTLVVGEGIRICHLAGEMAGEAAADAIARGRADRAVLEPYERAFRAEHARDLRVGYRLNRRLSAYDDREWDDGLRLLQAMPPELVLELLQSQFRIGRLLPWLARHPAQWRRAGALVGAVGAALYGR